MTEAPFDPAVQETVYMMASRLGKTEVISNIIGHGTAERPRRILVMYPTISQAEKWSKETYMEELVSSTPELFELVGDGAGKEEIG
jgi:phage terminase large subunit GpA-like protein